MDRRKEPVNTSPTKSVDALLGDSDLMSLVELQKFLAEELASSEGGSDYSRAFMPLTDGLGLASPPRKETAATPPSTGRRRMAVDDLFETDPLPSKAPVPIQVDADDEDDDPDALRELIGRSKSAAPAAPVKARSPLDDDEEITPTERVAARSIVAPPPAPIPAARPQPAAEPAPAPETKAVPPPMPAATFFRRLMAGFLDQVFVLTTWAGMLIITAGLLKGTGPDASAALLKELGNPQLIRFAALEFATVWLVYLALGIGVLDMTFGMWVWGLRLSYPGAKGDRAFLRKLLRVVFGFLIYAPVAPVVCLVFRRKGRNLLDWVSGTAVYRSLT